MSMYIMPSPQIVTSCVVISQVIPHVRSHMIPHVVTAHIVTSHVVTAHIVTPHVVRSAV
ncbi:hypothetical protein SHL15_2739 [Streptomyces hygroscopicus subsp. limoneus]|nr:hypothetical protein SHL15_2739 [Streptomyces hygroscopicus subsp. limoneus]